MTDRALTEKQVDELADLNELVINGLGRADVCVLIASHRLLWDVLEREREITGEAVKRVTQLEQMMGALGR